MLYEGRDVKSGLTFETETPERVDYVMAAVNCRSRNVIQLKHILDSKRFFSDFNFDLTIFIFYLHNIFQ